MEKKKSMPNINKLDGQCVHISQKEIVAQKASRASIKYMQCVFMNDKVGKLYKAIVSSIQDYGAFVEIIETKTEALVKLSSINGTWVSDTTNYCLKEHNTGEVIRLGDEVKIVISRVDIEKKNIDATMIKL